MKLSNNAGSEISSAANTTEGSEELVNKSPNGILSQMIDRKQKQLDIEYPETENFVEEQEFVASSISADQIMQLDSLIPYLTVAANKGSGKAQYQLGEIYLAGELAPKNEKLAFVYFELSVTNGYLDGFLALSNCYMNGTGTPKDKRKAMDLLNSGAERNHGQSLLKLAQIYRDGDRVERDERKSSTLFLRAARSCQSFSQFTDAIGGYGETCMFLIKICNHIKMPSSAKVLCQSMIALKKFAETGNIEAQYFFGQCYFYGWGVTSDFSLAKVWLAKASEGGLDAAKSKEYKWVSLYAVKQLLGSKEPWEQILLLEESNSCRAGEFEFSLAICFLFGIGVGQNKDMAQEHLEKAIQEGNSDAILYKRNRFVGIRDNIFIESMFRRAMTSLWNNQPWQGSCSQEGRKEAFELFKLGAKTNHVDSQLMLGVCYYDGMGTQWENLRSTNAFQCFTKAADEGNPIAELALARCYAWGHGVLSDKEKGQLMAHNGMKRVDKDNPIAQFFVGWCHCWGYGLEKNLGEGFSFFQKSMKGGYWRGSFELGWCYKSGVHVEKNVALAVEMMATSAGMGFAQAQHQLAAWCLKEGIVTPALDADRAKEWAERAKQQGHEEASRLLSSL